MDKTNLILKFFQKKDQLTVDNKEYQKTISSFFQWLTNNDKVNNDKTSKYLPNIITKAIIIAKENGIISGIEEIEYLLKTHTSLFFKSNISDGAISNKKDAIAEIKGNSHEILAYERTILNILQRMSGITTETNKFIKLSRPSHQSGPITNSSDRGHLLQTVNPPFITATRKTPWMGLDKKAVAVGGGLTHRLNLSDGILVKDNHLTFVSIENALETLLKRSHPARGGATSMELIEIEVKSEKEAFSVLNTYQKLKTTNHQTPNTKHLAILFDNFTPARVKSILSSLGNLYNLSDIIFEASGGIDKDNILEWSKTGMDIISLGALTHSTKAINISLEF